MKYLRKLALWLVFNIPLGSLAPILFGFGINRKGIKK